MRLVVWVERSKNSCGRRWALQPRESEPNLLKRILHKVRDGLKLNLLNCEVAIHFLDSEAVVRGKIEFYGREELVITTVSEVIVVQRSGVAYMIVLGKE